MTFHIRVRDTGTASVRRISGVLEAADAGVPLTRVSGLSDLVADSLGEMRATAWLVGIFAGLAWAVGRGLQSMLFGVRAWDVPTIATTAVILAGAALAAAWGPATLTLSVNPDNSQVGQWRDDHQDYAVIWTVTGTREGETFRLRTVERHIEGTARPPIELPWTASRHSS